MVTQKELVRIVNARIRIEKLDEEMKIKVAALAAEKAKLEASVKKAMDDLKNRVVTEKETIEDGKHFVKMVEVKPRINPKWKEEYFGLFTKVNPGSSETAEEERIKEVYGKDKKPTTDIEVI